MSYTHNTHVFGFTKTRNAQNTKHCGPVMKVRHLPRKLLKGDDNAKENADHDQDTPGKCLEAFVAVP